MSQAITDVHAEVNESSCHVRAWHMSMCNRVFVRACVRACVCV